MAFTTVTGSSGVTSLIGTSGIDVATIVTLTNNVFVGAQEANDTITLDPLGPVFTNNAFTINGGAGNDAIELRADKALLNSFVNGDGGTGTEGEDTFNFFGKVLSSDIRANGGNDFLRADLLENSTVNGNAGNDVIRVSDVNASFVFGGQGVDDIDVRGTGSNSLINGNKGEDNVFVFGRYESSSIYGGQGADKLEATLFATVNDEINKSAKGIFLSGDLGDDTAKGSNGIDTINGGDGADFIYGRNGGDILTGGAGSDRFVLENLGQSILSNATSSTGFDSITDFLPNSLQPTPELPLSGDVIDTFLNNPVVLGVQTITPGQLEPSLAQTLTNHLNIGAFQVALVNVSGAASFSGNYIVIDAGAAGFNFAADAVIKVDNLAGINSNTFV